MNKIEEKTMESNEETDGWMKNLFRQYIRDYLVEKINITLERFPLEDIKIYAMSIGKNGNEPILCYLRTHFNNDALRPFNDSFFKLTAEMKGSLKIEEYALVNTIEKDWCFSLEEMENEDK